MSIIDWLVLAITLLAIVIYGIYRSRHKKTLDSYLIANRELPWYNVCLSVMATQASAITFLSAPGQAYSDGMRFVQFYFGLPLAMIFLSATFIPAFRKFNIYTAYEFLERRFDHKTRKLTALLFLLQRGVSTGISIYAPSIVLSTVLNIPIFYTTMIIGVLVIIYTFYGGTLAVSHSQVLQMTIIFSSIIIAGVIVLSLIGTDATLYESLKIAGIHNRMNIIDFKFDWNNRYNVWSGIIGGFFLQLSYFGTDQSQVGRYLTGKDSSASKLGLIVNGMIKIPMQFVILFIGILVFSFYQFQSPPIFFNENIEKIAKESPMADYYNNLEFKYNGINQSNSNLSKDYLKYLRSNDLANAEFTKTKILQTSAEANEVKQEAVKIIKTINPEADINDTNFVFLHFVMHHFPKGLIGLIVAIIFLASMGSLAAGINSLTSTSVVDFYFRSSKKEYSETKKLYYSKIATLLWGIFCIICAFFAGNTGNLIEAVNILGSLFYGTILGIFISAIFVKQLDGNSVFIAALITEAIIITFWYFDVMAFLWLNLAGCLLVVFIAFIIQFSKQNLNRMFNKPISK